MTDIFISYARADRPRVESLAKALAARGFAIWWDKNIEGGSEFSRETEDRLNGAAAVLVCWSRASVESMWVADEATVGRENGALVPIAIDPVAPKLGFRQIQTIDFSTWTGAENAPELDELARALRAKLALKGVAPPDSPARLAPASAAPVPASAAPPRLAGRLLALALGVLAIAAATIFWATRSSDRGDLARSVAVLPFEDRSENGASSGYGDWLAELVSGLLGKAGGLTVISQTSAASFKGEVASIAEIAKRLGVALIVEGSVRRDGDDIIISAKLIDASEDRQIWAEIYRRKGGDALDVQSEVAASMAAAIAGKMKATIAAEETAALAAPAQPEAIEKYQQALGLYRTTVDSDVRNAQALLNDAIKLDADFALAWALLARVHAYFYFNSSDATDARRAAAEAALAQAVRLAPDLAEVMLADAYHQYWIVRDYNGAKRRFETLRQRWPNNTDILTALASIARRQGRWEDSKAYFESAVAIDPLRPGRRLKAAEANLATRDFDGALRQLDASLEIWPSPPENSPFIAKKALVYQALGRLDDAAALLEGFDPQPDGYLAQPIAYQGLLTRRPSEAIARIETLLGRDAAAGSAGRDSADLNLYLGDLRRLAGDLAGAAENYRKVREELAAELAQQPDSADLHSYLALAEAGLGDQAEAERHAKLAMTAVPVSKDALSGAYYLDVGARIYSRFGDRKNAIPAITALMNMPASFPLTPAILRLDPDFDAIRDDPQFEALLAGAR